MLRNVLTTLWLIVEPLARLLASPVLRMLDRADTYPEPIRTKLRRLYIGAAVWLVLMVAGWSFVLGVHVLWGGLILYAGNFAPMAIRRYEHERSRKWKFGVIPAELGVRFVLGFIPVPTWRKHKN